MKEPKKTTTKKKAASSPASMAAAPIAKARKKIAEVVAPSTLSAVDRDRHIQEAAFLLAEKDGFAGSPDFYWSQAEQQLEVC